MPDILQEYANLGLLDIGDDDSRLELLRTAAAELAKEMESSPRLAIYHALAVSAPDPSPTDTVFAEVAEHVQSQWKLYRNRFADVPRELFKAVSLQALATASSSSNDIALGLGYLSRTLLLKNIPLRQQKTVVDFFDRLNGGLENAALELWATRPTGARQQETPVPAVKVTKLDREKISSGVIAAVGPTDLLNQAITNANPYWPANNANWAKELGSRLAEIIATAVETGLLQLNTELQRVNKSVIESLRADPEEKASTWASITRQTQLLWWRKALYSATLKCSYRHLDPADAVVAMSFDYFGIIKEIAPLSAEFLLCEAVEDVCKGGDSVSISQLVKSVQTVSRASVAAHGNLVADRSGLQPLAENLIRLACEKQVAQADVLGPNTASACILARRLYLELQALDLCVLKTPGAAK
jgi:hypothetical protein